MLERIDRVTLTARDAAAVAGRWCQLLDAVVDRRDGVPALSARRIVIRLGDSEVEILEPTGEGPVAEHLASGRGGVFAAGACVRDLGALERSLASKGIAARRLAGQLFLDELTLGVPGLRMVLSPSTSRDRVGLFTCLYEVTHLTGDAPHTAQTLAMLFGLDRRAFVPIRSEQFGYDGSLTLFRPDALHRIETINPYDRNKTMGRYFGRFGPGLYMCYAETDDLPKVRERLERLAPHDWTGSKADNNGLFIHPKALGGVMVGVSRTSYAWTWSGHPDRVQPLR